MKLILTVIGLVAFAGVFAAAALFEALRPDVVLRGSAKTCVAGGPDPVRGVNISAFKVKHARPIVAQLRTMDRFTRFASGDSAATSRFNAMDAHLRSMIVGTPALTRRTSASDGSFSLSLAPVDSVLVVGYHDAENDPYAYAHEIISEPSSKSFVLDMSHGRCGLVQQAKSRRSGYGLSSP